MLEKIDKKKALIKKEQLKELINEVNRCNLEDVSLVIKLNVITKVLGTLAQKERSDNENKLLMTAIYERDKADRMNRGPCDSSVDTILSSPTIPPRIG